ncbi:MAG: ATP-binding protein [Ruminococcaceae bacterium]|nr:ATP-binding protein [Oscillospiraceae bacterium]
MANNNKARQYAFDEIEKRRFLAVDKEASIREKEFEEVPELARIDLEISSAGANLVKGILSGVLTLDHVEARMNELEEKKNRVRSKIKTCDKIYLCPKCGDTGYFKGDLCSCTKELIKEYRKNEIARTSPLELSTFANFSLEYYSKEVYEKFNMSPRENMIMVYETCIEFVNKFPSSDNLLMMGDAGLGKTHLALSIADALLKKGHNVIYCSASNIFKKVESEYFEDYKNSDTLDTLKTADLLIIDDLGAEYVNSFIVSAIYDIVNTRLVEKKSTIYTTNITKSPILESRYGEKVSSRLTGCCRLLFFYGDDIRLKNKG